MARIYNIGDIKVVEFVILLRAELTCSQAEVKFVSAVSAGGSVKFLPAV